MFVELPVFGRFGQPLFAHIHTALGSLDTVHISYVYLKLMIGGVAGQGC